MPTFYRFAAQTPNLYWLVTGASMVVAGMPTLWTTLDLLVAGLFVESAASVSAKSWWWVELINAYVPAVFRGFVLIALVLWLVVTLGRHGKQWRLPLAFVVLAGAVGPGLVVNSVFKDHWQRARPYQVENFGGTQKFTRAAVMTDQCDNNCSFVSGHVACGVFLASLMLVLRRRRLWAAIGMLSGAVIGFARMADNAHWLSDVLWAYPITLLCSWMVWRVLLNIYPIHPEPSDSAI